MDQPVVFLDAADLHTGPLPRGAASRYTVARWTPPLAAQPRQRLDLHAATQLRAGRFLHSAASWWTPPSCPSCAPWGRIGMQTRGGELSRATGRREPGCRRPAAPAEPDVDLDAAAALLPPCSALRSACGLRPAAHRPDRLELHGQVRLGRDIALGESGEPGSCRRVGGVRPCGAPQSLTLTPREPLRLRRVSHWAHWPGPPWRVYDIGLQLLPPQVGIEALRRSL